MYNYRPDWLPKEERLEVYGAGQFGPRYWITSRKDGTRYLWYRKKPKYARKPRWVKVRELPEIRKVEHVGA